MAENTLKALSESQSLPDLNDREYVSVVVPVYNVERYLRECLDSVINQTFRDLEIILVDDGSTDSSGAICDEYGKRDARIKVVHKGNNGLGNARNVGMDAASGKYIIFLDSDDYWDLNTIETLYKIAERDNLQVLVFSGEPFWEDMEQPQHFMDYCHHAQNGIIRQGPDSLQTAFNNNEYFVSVCMRFYRLSYIKEQGTRFDEGIIHEDESFSLITYLFANRIECIGERFYKRRHRPGSIMTTRSLVQSMQGYARALDTMISFYQRKDLTAQERVLLARYMKLFVIRINSAYSKSLTEEWNSHNYLFRKSHAIRRDTQKTMRKAGVLRPYLSKEQMISTYSLLGGYCIPRLEEKMRQNKRRMISMVKGLGNAISKR